MKNGHSKNFGRVSARKRKKGKTSKFVDAGTTEKGINSIEWIDREEWRRKVKLKLKSQKDVKISILCT